MSIEAATRERDAAIKAAEATRDLQEKALAENVRKAMEDMKTAADIKALEAGAAAERQRIIAEEKVAVERAEAKLREQREMEAKNIEWTQRQNEPPKDK
ncbi:MAG: hypothetical protein ABIZ81_09595 [Opitutaceae bacterium]